MRLGRNFALFVAGLLAVTSWAEDPFRLKPGARGETCLECHIALQETMQLKHVHTPVREGACADCHNPHAASHGMLLDEEIGAVCAGCHDGIVPDEAMSLHAALTDGDCTICHDPHASENPNNLVAAGNDLCASCHEEISAQASSSRFSHPPAQQDCLTCHNPHASTRAEFLLTSAPAELCGECHDTSEPTFGQRHMGYPVAESRCSSCHDPHGSETTGMFLANVHEPLTNKMCNQCHMNASAPDALQTKRAGMELCRGCHSDVLNEMSTRNRLHWPAADATACLNCHNPHASNQASLLIEPTLSLCGSCHAETIAQQEMSLSKHPPIAEGQCSVCHAPHASDNVFLLSSASINDACGDCHEWKSHSAHPIGEEFADQRNSNLHIDCQSCHDTHGSPFNGFAHLDPGGDLCVSCHADVSR